MSENFAGRFISLEGGEGAGKSTQIRLLADYLRQQGIEVLLTREPGGSTGAEEIRNLLVSGETDRWDGVTEALLHFAARRDHLLKTVFPALKKGIWVLTDRYADSTLAYQGYGHGLPLDKLYALWDLAVDGFKPDMTFLLDMPVETGLERAFSRGDGEDRYEKMGHAFHQKLRNGFLEMAQNDPKRFRVIDARNTIDQVHEDLSASLGLFLKGGN